MDGFWKHQISKIVDFITRQRRPAYILLGFGASILATKNLINYAIAATFSWGTLSIGTDNKNVLADYLVPIIGTLLCFSGLAIVIIDEFQAYKNNSRKRIILMKGDGLRTTVGSGLEALVRSSLKGTIISLPIDITQRFRDGYVIEPERTFTNIVLPTKTLLGKLLENMSPEDVQIVYGGFLPVPFTFFLGNVLDDKGNITVYDWDRESESWKIISDKPHDDDDDDGNFIHELVRDGDINETVLIISCSYLVNLEKVMKSFKGLTIEHLKLENISFNNHWSLAKQSRLALQFAEKIKSLSDKGVKTIHLILAAQSSVVLNLGRRYDSRNMPELIVYQHERTNDEPYPWGVWALSHGREESGCVIKNN
ncbi:SAVED domain-containing protein [Xenorhabdus bovienii]|uniref:SAVED domain-containing protein n=1 Tax=Xenorhabdus bovienii TaxID=40576 RepID=UPI003DA4FB45